MTDSLDTVSRYLTALGDRDLDRASSFLSDDVQAIDVPLGLTLRGRGPVVEALAERLRAFPDTSLTSNGSWPVAIGSPRSTSPGEHITACWRPPQVTCRATGRVLETQMAEWFCVQEGLITVSRAYWDVAGALRQLGVGD